MKIINTKKLTKKIICIIIFLMLCNFIMPNNIFAAEEEDSGTVFAPVCKFITFLCDNVMQFMQDTFTTPQKIKTAGNIYNFQYSPAIIFSGTVQAFDVNFIKPNTDIRSEGNYESFFKEKQKEYYKRARKQSWGDYNSILQGLEGYQVITDRQTDITGLFTKYDYEIYYLQKNGVLDVRFLASVYPEMRCGGCRDGIIYIQYRICC